MRLFPQDDDVELYETGFDNDILERKSISKQLSELVEKIESPMVLALDDKWGAGKTYFLKRWVAAHTKENAGTAITVYFDAFESDYLSDPLVAIITAVSDRVPEKEKSTVQKWKTIASKLAKPTFGLALSMATFGAKRYFDEIGDAIADAAEGEVKDAAQGLWNAEKDRKDSVKAFKDLLVDLTQNASTPIVIVIDELDRCRPDYALSILEIIKHFFSVPKVHFILGVNGEALESCVRARYGAGIDAESYLRKFISASFSLPRTVGRHGNASAIVHYAASLVSEMKLPEKVANPCINLLSYVTSANEVSLRDVGKILSKIALVPKEVTDNDYLDGWIETLCILLVASVISPKLHKKFSAADASVDEIRTFLGARKSKISDMIGDTYNPEYDHKLAIWFAVTTYACGSISLAEVEELKSWNERMGHSFERSGKPRDPKGIAAKIQKEWVEIFRL